MPKAEPNFEQSLEQLETIIERIESGAVGLEEAIREWERGIALVKHCREVLQKAEQRIADLTAQMQQDAPPG